MKTVTILVQEDKQKAMKVVCNPDPLEVMRGKQVKFDCRYPFAVHFSRSSPFPEMSYNGKGSKETTPIPDDKPFGTYKYFVAVYKQEADQVLTEDPDIIIVPKEG